jgi:hypothetical protein
MLLGMESFDIYDTAHLDDYAVSHGAGAIVAGAGRCGTAAWHGTAADGSGPIYGAPATTLSGFCGFAKDTQGFQSTPDWAVQRSDGTQLAFLRVLPNGAVEGWKGVNTILGGVVCTTAPNLIHANHYSAIGVEWLISATGYLRIYVDNQLHADSGTVDMTTFYSAGQWGLLNFTPSGYIDDLYWGDTAVSATNPWNAYLGDCHVEGQTVNSDAVGGPGAFREWTPSTGSDQGAVVNEIPPNDGATYLTSNTVGQRSTMTFPSVIPASGSIFGTLLMPNALKTTFASRSIANLLYSGTTLNVGTSQGVAQTNYRYYPQMYAYNPVTGLAWTISEINAMQGGLEITV